MVDHDPVALMAASTDLLLRQPQEQDTGASCSSSNPNPNPNITDPWGTWEELLLGSAVQKHGVDNWTLVSAELQSRITASFLLTPEACRAQYQAIKRRIRSDDASKGSAIPLFEELRKLRVEQLRRELEQSDNSIGLLQNRIKRLMEQGSLNASSSIPAEETPECPAQTPSKDDFIRSAKQGLNTSAVQHGKQGVNTSIFQQGNVLTGSDTVPGEHGNAITDPATLSLQHGNFRTGVDENSAELGSGVSLDQGNLADTAQLPRKCADEAPTPAPPHYGNDVRIVSETDPPCQEIDSTGAQRQHDNGSSKWSRVRHLSGSSISEQNCDARYSRKLDVSRVPSLTSDAFQSSGRLSASVCSPSRRASVGDDKSRQDGATVKPSSNYSADFEVREHEQPSTVKLKSMVDTMAKENVQKKLVQESAESLKKQISNGSASQGGEVRTPKSMLLDPPLCSNDSKSASNSLSMKLASKLMSNGHRSASNMKFGHKMKSLSNKSTVLPNRSDDDPLLPRGDTKPGKNTKVASTKSSSIARGSGDDPVLPGPDIKSGSNLKSITKKQSSIPHCSDDDTLLPPSDTKPGSNPKSSTKKLTAIPHRSDDDPLLPGTDIKSVNNLKSTATKSSAIPHRSDDDPLQPGVLHKKSGADSGNPRRNLSCNNDEPAVLPETDYDRAKVFACELTSGRNVKLSYSRNSKSKSRRASLKISSANQHSLDDGKSLDARSSTSNVVLKQDTAEFEKEVRTVCTVKRVDNEVSKKTDARSSTSNAILKHNTVFEEKDVRTVCTLKRFDNEAPKKHAFHDGNSYGDVKHNKHPGGMVDADVRTEGGGDNVVLKRPRGLTVKGQDIVPVKGQESALPAIKEKSELTHTKLPDAHSDKSAESDSLCSPRIKPFFKRRRNSDVEIRKTSTGSTENSPNEVWGESAEVVDKKFTRLYKKKGKTGNLGGRWKSLRPASEESLEDTETKNPSPNMLSTVKTESMTSTKPSSYNSVEDSDRKIPSPLVLSSVKTESMTSSHEVSESLHAPGHVDDTEAWQQMERLSGDSRVEKSEMGSFIDGNEDASPISKRNKREPKVPGKLIPLLESLRTVCAHKCAHFFKHNHDSQGNRRYQLLIRYPLDLCAIRTKLEEGYYSGSLHFFRDLLLMINNALVYYRKDAPESIAASGLRECILKEMKFVFETEALVKQEGPSFRKRDIKRGGRGAAANQGRRRGLKTPALVEKQRDQILKQSANNDFDNRIHHDGGAKLKRVLSEKKSASNAYQSAPKTSDGSKSVATVVEKAVQSSKEFVSSKVKASYSPKDNSRDKERVVDSVGNTECASGGPVKVAVTKPSPMTSVKVVDSSGRKMKASDAVTEPPVKRGVGRPPKHALGLQQKPKESPTNPPRKRVKR